MRPRVSARDSYSAWFPGGSGELDEPKPAITVAAGTVTLSESPVVLVMSRQAGTWPRPTPRLSRSSPDQPELTSVPAGMSSSSLTRVHTTLTRALRWAQRRGKVYRNVSELVETPVGSQRPSQALTVAQVQAVLEAAKKDRLQALWILGLILGLRPRELTGLRWQDIDIDAGMISIWQSLKHRKGQVRMIPDDWPRGLIEIRPNTRSSYCPLDFMFLPLGDQELAAICLLVAGPGRGSTADHPPTPSRRRLSGSALVRRGRSVTGSGTQP